METQADEDANNPWPFAGPARRVAGRDGEATPLGPSSQGTEFQGEGGVARRSDSAKKAAATRRTGARRDKAGAAIARVRVRHARPGSLPAARPIYRSGASRHRSRPAQVGRAAWYGNQHVGRLTASGERLDTVHATAAHRSLPLHSLVRVTNLQNGRSVVVRINDRGPVSRSLLIECRRAPPRRST